MRMVLTGGGGQLGAYVLKRLKSARHDLFAWSSRRAETRDGVPLTPVDLTDWPAVEAALTAADPEVILHLAAVSSAEAVRLDPCHGALVNVQATEFLAEWCRGHGRRLVFTSTDLVFDGSRPWWREDDPPAPILAYGQTKARAESAFRGLEGGLVARLPLLFGPSRCGRLAFFDRAMNGLRRGEPQTCFEDEYRTPLDYASAADALVRLAERSETGILHLGGTERVSRFELALRSAVALGLDASLVRANRQADAPSPEPRPADASLDSSRLMAVLPDLDRPTIEEALRRMI